MTTSATSRNREQERVDEQPADQREDDEKQDENEQHWLFKLQASVG